MPKRASTLLLTLLAAACGGDDGGNVVVPPDPELVVSPATVEITEAAPTGSLFLASGGVAGGAWQISQTPPWITAVPESGTLSGQIVEIQLTADFSSLPDLVTEGSVSVISDIGSGSARVRATGDPLPRAEVSHTELLIHRDSAQTRFSLRNVGRSDLQYGLTGVEAWLSVNPASGFLPPQGVVSVAVAGDRVPLALGTHQGSLLLTTNGEPASLSLPVSIEVPPAPELEASLRVLKFPGGEDARTVRLSNPGKGDLTWTVTSQPSWVTTTPSTGTVPQGAGVDVTVSVDRAAAGSFAADSIVIGSNAPEPLVLRAVVSDGLVPELGVTELDHRVVDAEYDPTANRIITVSNDPATLHAVDVELGITESVALPSAATSVAVEPSGEFAAVGHNANVSIVDLVSMSVVRTYPVDADVIDVVLPGNGWVYVFPRRDQWETIRSLDLQTGAVSRTGTIRAGTLVRLHPSGDYIYGADNGLSPSDIEKYDIRGGVAEYMYDSPYHGDYGFAGNLWISESGDRIFARSGHVFRSSSTASEDMLFGGTLAGSGPMVWAVTSSATGRVYFIREDTPSDLLVVEEGFLGYQGSVPLAPFDTPSGPASSYGRFAFAHSDGSRLFVLVQADPAAGLRNDWGIIVLDTSQLP